MSSPTLPVNEMFYTFQGEGINMGRAAFFIRLHGCPVHCPWCDSAGTWHPNHIPDGITRWYPEELATKAMENPARLAVITGGEPCIHNLAPLISQLHARGFEVSIETCGAFPLPPPVACLTVSPKWNKLPKAEALMMAREVKLIIETPESIQQWLDKLAEILGVGSYINFVRQRVQTVWLHPEWSQAQNPAVLNAITEAVKMEPRLRAGWQLHKNYRADNLDARSRQAVPLGGDPAKGF